MFDTSYRSGYSSYVDKYRSPYSGSTMASASWMEDSRFSSRYRSQLESPRPVANWTSPSPDMSMTADSRHVVEDESYLLTDGERALLAAVDREGTERTLRHKYMETLSPEELSERYLAFYTRQCPGCGARVQRDAFSGGCPMVTCAYCQTPFRCEIADY
mmetsp:Transcript_21512/g.47275  ORF Transcript_21512/g.47275 Transcript_21512/m.47275 type:complete len:159 (+) Transcript_21512:41-517(+)